jgi:hypothetical protein
MTSSGESNNGWALDVTLLHRPRPVSHHHDDDPGKGTPCISGEILAAQQTAGFIGSLEALDRRMECSKILLCKEQLFSGFWGLA